MSKRYRSKHEIWLTILEKYGDLLEHVSPGQKIVFTGTLISSKKNDHSFLDLVVRLIQQDMQHILESEFDDREYARDKSMTGNIDISTASFSTQELAPDDMDIDTKSFSVWKFAPSDTDIDGIDYY
jgi:hypothetical protein